MSENLPAVSYGEGIQPGVEDTADSQQPGGEGAGNGGQPSQEQGQEVEMLDARDARESGRERREREEREAQQREAEAQRRREEEAEARRRQVQAREICKGKGSKTCKICHLPDCPRRRDNPVECTTPWEKVMCYRRVTGAGRVRRGSHNS